MSILFSDFLRNFIDTLKPRCYIQDTEINKKQIGGKTMKSSIGEILKKCRLESGKSVKDISDLLISKGFKGSEKTIYSWESGNSQPTPDALLIMCKAYGISDVLSTFGYAEPSEPTTLAAHFDGEEYTESEMEEIKNFADFVKNRRK